MCIVYDHALTLMMTNRVTMIAFKRILVLGFVTLSYLAQAQIKIVVVKFDQGKGNNFFSQYEINCITVHWKF